VELAPSAPDRRTDDRRLNVRVNPVVTGWIPFVGPWGWTLTSSFGSSPMEIPGWSCIGCVMDDPFGHTSTRKLPLPAQKARSDGEMHSPSLRNHCQGASWYCGKCGNDRWCLPTSCSY